MNKQINQDKLEDWLIENIRLHVDKHNAEIKKSRAVSSRQKDVDIAKLRSKIEKLKDLYLEDLIPKDIYEKDYNELTAAIKAAEEKQRESQLQPLDTSLFKNFKEMYGSLAPESRKAFWSRTLKKITATRDGEFTVTFN